MVNTFFLVPPGLEFNFEKSGILKSSHMLHGLPLKLIVEVGLIFTLIFYGMILKFIKDALMLSKYQSIKVAAVGILFWFFVSLTVDAMNNSLGVFLGLGLINAENS